MSFAHCDVVRQFEAALAEYAGAPYAVAVDTCTAGLFLCCRRLRVQNVAIPRRTFVGVPMAVMHAGGVVRFTNEEWIGIYRLEPYPIIDGACRFRRGMYDPGTLHCLSFQYRKHLAIGRGGAVLTDNAECAEWLRKARFFGRAEGQETPEFLGWNAYMEPERAARGLSLLTMMPACNHDLRFDYPDLAAMEVFK